MTPPAEVNKEEVHSPAEARSPYNNRQLMRTKRRRQPLTRSVLSKTFSTPSSAIKTTKERTLSSTTIHTSPASIHSALMKFKLMVKLMSHTFSRHLIASQHNQDSLKKNRRGRLLKKRFRTTMKSYLSSLSKATWTTFNTDSCLTGKTSTQIQIEGFRDII